MPLTVKFVKSVTHARADRSADTVQIKINSDDNINAGDIYNDREKPQDTPYVPGIPEKKKGSLEIIKVDAKTGEALAGAKFRIRSDNKSFGERYEVSDEQGTVRITDLETGRYYVCETEAPDGYNVDDTVYELDVEAGEKAVISIENSRAPEEDTPDRPDKDKPEKDKPKKNKEVKEKVPQTGDVTGVMTYIAVMLAALLAGLLTIVRRFAAGKIRKR